MEIIVPKGKCPLDVLAEMGDVFQDTRILFHEDVIAKLKLTADDVVVHESDVELIWKATETIPETNVVAEVFEDSWFKVKIEAEDIAFKSEPPNPKNVFHVVLED